MFSVSLGYELFLLYAILVWNLVGGIYPVAAACLIVGSFYFLLGVAIGCAMEYVYQKGTLVIKV